MTLLVVLVKSSNNENDEHNEYSTLLLNNGFNSIIASPNEFIFYNRALLEEHLIVNHANYWCLAVTSPRAAQEVHAVLTQEANKAAFNIWKNKRIYAVGQSTAKALPFIENILIPTYEQNALGLVNECILKDYMENKSFLRNLSVFFPCGDLSIENLPNILFQVTISCKSCTVYRTVPRKNFCSSFKNKISPWLNKGVHFAVVFFSPSCFKNSVRVVGETLASEKSTMIAIGKPTHNAIKNSLRDKDIIVCHKPTPKGVLDVILNL